jgi:hypothetical protein
MTAPDRERRNLSAAPETRHRPGRPRPGLATELTDIDRQLDDIEQSEAEARHPRSRATRLNDDRTGHKAPPTRKEPRHEGDRGCNGGWRRRWPDRW